MKKKKKKKKKEERNDVGVRLSDTQACPSSLDLIAHRNQLRVGVVPSGLGFLHLLFMRKTNKHFGYENYHLQVERTGFHQSNPLSFRPIIGSLGFLSPQPKFNSSIKFSQAWELLICCCTIQMVFGIILFTILEAGLNINLIASRYFTPEGNDARMKERTQAIVQRAIDDFRHLQSCSEALERIYSRGLPVSMPSQTHASGIASGSSSNIIDEIGEMIGSVSAADRLVARDFSQGLFSIAGGGMFHQSKVAVWHQIGSGKLVCVLVCDKDESRGLARSFLESFITIRELSSLPVEKILEIWHVFLPCGRLTFLPPKTLP